MTVYGVGERRTPVSLRAACDKFIYLDVLRGVAPTAKSAKAIRTTEAEVVPAKSRPAGKKAGKQQSTPTHAEPERTVENRGESKSNPRTDSELHELLIEAIEDAADDDGWATDRKSTRLNSSQYCATRMPSSD